MPCASYPATAWGSSFCLSYSEVCWDWLWGSHSVSPISVAWSSPQTFHLKILKYVICSFQRPTAATPFLSGPTHIVDLGAVTRKPWFSSEDLSSFSLSWTSSHSGQLPWGCTGRSKLTGLLRTKTCHLLLVEANHWVGSDSEEGEMNSSSDGRDGHLRIHLSVSVP